MSNKILVVDDEPCILRSLQFQLERVGKLDVITAEDGEEAMKLIEKERPCLIFLDIMLPSKNGYEICRQIKTDPGLSDIHVIILSARGQINEISKGIELGADEYMTKPFDPSVVLERAKKILAGIT
ncbi:MAG: hypothetical protein CO150_02645 [Nitrospirae bacterium CG_4_9_14_3_um_filter_53_35]|nr:MAG: hypothetical protein AUK29_10405 [Nitrospirae bacterium CG2_30_53_67]PIS38343.1 MAG: hypothetical protein COT35_01385 [Nitrospirae bacterium CG08_land_8_20_14_0_20_52_24]PIV84102.1 MAG: hypothetical protein COW52_07890 [Nitrospirae bacterium CG17_big_fil_post_rev_8_21_14_2_50_50_9]PIW85211.1 MAG: hypothetical protein COZ95_05775 [Nitrospirae bacterium CG_4_8_14_3_um_filter_50_41]PIX84604.1 MAG: hypothetical protein COZ32_12810 [Nitrospirae bacterium CG_4_10_14_3_um_filter_53_41]PJA7677